MESHYDMKSWADEAALGKRIYNYNFRMFGGEVAGWQLLKAVPMHRDDGLLENTYLWENKNAPKQQLVRVNVGELADWRAAQKHLLELLEHSMRPDIPRGSGALAALGDIEFVARAPRSDIPASIQFTRGNVAVAVNSVGSVTSDVSKFATVVDRMLTELPTKVPSLKKYAKARAPKSVRIRGKEAAPLLKNLSNLGDSWLKVVVPDGELRRRDNALVYLSAKPGQKSVQVYTIRAGASERKK